MTITRINPTYPIAYGNTWSSLEVDHNGVIYRLQVDSGGNVRLYKSTDGGASWSSQAITGASGFVVARSVTVTVDKINGRAKSVTAPTVSGYTFVSWVHCATSGWVGSCYMQVPTSSTTNVWVAAGGGSSGTGSVVCTAIYSKNSL